MNRVAGQIGKIATHALHFISPSHCRGYVRIDQRFLKDVKQKIEVKAQFFQGGTKLLAESPLAADVASAAHFRLCRRRPVHELRRPRGRAMNC